MLEPQVDVGTLSFCSDFVRFINLELDLVGLGVDLDEFGALCGEQDTFLEQYTGPPLLVCLVVMTCMIASHSECQLWDLKLQCHSKLKLYQENKLLLTRLVSLFS